jgi:hypothetical protein
MELKEDALARGVAAARRAETARVAKGRMMSLRAYK